MCYINIKKIDTPRQKVFYKVVRRPLESVFTKTILTPGVPMRATNVPSLGSIFEGHSYMDDFEGWGVFSRLQQAVVYANLSSCLKVVKVHCKDNPRVATISADSRGGGAKCYLFDTITILNGGETV